MHEMHEMHEMENWMNNNDAMNTLFLFMVPRRVTLVGCIA